MNENVFRLNLGCGNTKEDVFHKDSIRCDWNKDTHPDILLDLNRPLPFKSGTIQSIEMYRVIGHLKNPSKAMNEIKRVLRPNGWAIIFPCGCDNINNKWNNTYNIRKDDNGICSVEIEKEQINNGE